jgi:hypothetical protein
VIHPAGRATADAPIAAPPFAFLRLIFNVTLLLAAFAAVSFTINRLAPFPEVPGIFPKWEFFKKHRDRYDVLFIGSSRFYHQIIPPQFDAAAVAAGVKLESFNFGYDAMWPPESYYLLRRLLELRPSRLKWVVIDLMDIQTQLDERNESTLRTAYWHDVPHTILALREILSSKLQSAKKRELLEKHARLGIAHALNLGRGADLTNRLFAPKPARRKPFTWAKYAGFEAEPAAGLTGPAREEFLDRVASLRARLAPSTPRPIFREALSGIIRDVRRAGAEPIFVIAPTLNVSENFESVPDGAALIPLNNPTEFPELYDPDHHYDPWHLNEKGAVDFTAILARRFLERVRP